MIEWRWDQGRVLYFQYDVLKDIAKVLVKYDGMNVNSNEIADLFKSSLIEETELPFLPMNYKVNRNYSRVFQCALLATTKDKGILVVSDICKKLASQSSPFDSADDYLFEVIKRFRFPFPAFQEYTNKGTRAYPFCAILKMLIAKQKLGTVPCLSIDEVSRYIIGNNCTGIEDIDFYKGLKDSGYILKGDSSRQVREMITFIGQFSFLKIFDKKIYLDLISEEDAKILLNALSVQIPDEPLSDKVEEFVSLTKMPLHIVTANKQPVQMYLLPSVNSSDIEFAEGKRKRAYHLRIERSPLLRRAYMKIHSEPVCDACKLRLKEKYPWVDYLLDLHHLLPLSSVIRIGDTSTSLNDMVGLCPTCHRAIHSFYNRWLKDNDKEDFVSKKEALDVYLEAVRHMA